MMDNIEQMNKEVAEWLGICWHEFGKTTGYCINCGHNVPDTEDNPDFSQGAGIIRLLKEMMKQEDWEDFLMSVGGHTANGMFIRIDYITTLGKLLEAVHEWSKEHPK
jgi:hypothetical protein